MWGKKKKASPVVEEKKELSVEEATKIYIEPALKDAESLLEARDRFFDNILSFDEKPACDKCGNDQFSERFSQSSYNQSYVKHFPNYRLYSLTRMVLEQKYPELKCGMVTDKYSCSSYGWGFSQPDEWMAIQVKEDYELIVTTCTNCEFSYNRLPKDHND